MGDKIRVVADQLQLLKGVKAENAGVSQPRKATRVLRNPSMDEAVGQTVIANTRQSISFGELAYGMSMMNPSSTSALDIEVETSLVIGDDVPMPSNVNESSSFGLPDGDGIQVSILAGKSELSKETSNSNQHDGGNIMGSAPLSGVGFDLESIFGIKLKSLGDMDELTKGIETGKYEAVLNGMTIEKRNVVIDAKFAMWDRILAANPNC
ncbi:hypothetical protein Tco_1387104 [Tanacetum coccineum]